MAKKGVAPLWELLYIEVSKLTDPSHMSPAQCCNIHLRFKAAFDFSQGDFREELVHLSASEVSVVPTHFRNHAKMAFNRTTK